jgi:GcrA cell cycle regulator
MTSLWTDANIERLKTLFFENKSMAEIAALIPGSTRNGVIGKLHRLNLRNENRPPKERRSRKPYCAYHAEKAKRHD